MSGFDGIAADRYKLEIPTFAQQLQAMADADIQPRKLITDMVAGHAPSPQEVVLTFDDGGVSFLTVIADMLEAKQWKGHFFVSTSKLGQSGFLTAQQVKTLYQRGHLIGSHSDSHPLRMAALSYQQIVNEWTISKKRLEDILGVEIIVASVPGGLYSTQVARAANEAGIAILFNSEPVTQVSKVDDCRVLGRYAVWDKTTNEQVIRLATGDQLEAFKAYASWNSKKAFKKIGGSAYLLLRKIWIDG